MKDNKESISNHQEQRLEELLNKAQTELNLLHDISNAMRTTLKLDEILYIILTAATAHAGLGFNRAMLFLVNEKDGYIEGKMGIGPDTGEDADRIWKYIESEKMDLDKLIEAYRISEDPLATRLNKTIRNIRVPIEEKGSNLMSMAISQGAPIHVKDKALEKYGNDLLYSILQTQEFVIVPLKAKDKVTGLILADNIYTRKPISEDDIRILSMFANQAGLAIENSQLYELTLTRSNLDSLTQVWNHGYFQSMLQEEIERSRKKQSILSIIMLDIDNFKNYNDTFGHQTGDYVLSEISELLMIHARKKDFVCRYGGEEFITILPETSKKDAIAIAERIRLAIDKHTFIKDDSRVSHKLTISVGIATYPEDAQNKSDLIKFCDMKMYEAKKLGKNKVCC